MQGVHAQQSMVEGPQIRTGHQQYRQVKGRHQVPHVLSLPGDGDANPPGSLHQKHLVLLPQPLKISQEDLPADFALSIRH